MAKKKYKLKNTGNNENYWETSGIFDIDQNKTQREINNSIQTSQKWDIKKQGKIIFVGNSYSRLNRSGASVYDYRKWPEYTAAFLGLNYTDHYDPETFRPIETEDPNWDWFHIGGSGHSLVNNDVNKRYITDITNWVESHQNDGLCDQIGAVVLIAGINDSRSSRVNDMPTALQDLSRYIRSNLPNAVLYNGYCGWINSTNPNSWDDDRTPGMRSTGHQYYIRAKRFGWNYLNGVENIFHSKNYFIDYIHPNDSGSLMIGTGVANALCTGSCEASYTSTAYPDNIFTEYLPTSDTTPSSSKTYFTRSGSSPDYEYTRFTGSTFSSGTTYYEIKTVSYRKTFDFERMSGKTYYTRSDSYDYPNFTYTEYSGTIDGTQTLYERTEESQTTKGMQQIYTAIMQNYSKNSTAHTVSISGRFQEWLTNELVRTMYNSIEVQLDPPITLTANIVYPIGNVILNLSNSVDFNNQIISVVDNEDNQCVMFARVYIEGNTGNIKIQVKQFADGSTSKTVKKILRFVTDTTYSAINN